LALIDERSCVKAANPHRIMDIPKETAREFKNVRCVALVYLNSVYLKPHDDSIHFRDLAPQGAQDGSGRFESALAAS
jgi:hypothetical protein